MTISEASVTHRQKGNEAFRTANYAEAAASYTVALAEGALQPTLDGDLKEHLAAIFSNRAAARINLFELDLALLDSAAALRLSPGFSRAKARAGEALAKLHSFREAHVAYLAASELAEDDPTRERYRATAASMKRQVEAAEHDTAHPALVAAEESIEFAKKYDKFVLDGGEVENLVSANTAVYAWTMADKAFGVLDEKLKVLESGEVESESPSPVLDVADSIITDARGFHLPPGKDHDLPLSEKLRLQLSWDTRVFGLAEHLKKEAIPRNVIDHFAKEVETEGWQRVKLVLAHLIRGSFVAAFINETQGRTLEACSQFRFVLGLLQEGRERWKDVSDDDRGSTFRFTFERKVKMHLVESLVDGHFRAETPAERELFSLVEVKALAEEIMDDCHSSKAPGDPVSTFAFQVQPIVAAGKAFAYTLRHQAQEEANRIDFSAGYFLHPKMMRATARLYKTAGELLPRDDPEKAVNLFNALAFDLRAGGNTVRELFERASIAEAALVPPERIFATSPRQFDARTLVRTACETARTHVATGLPFDIDRLLDTRLKPVAAVFPSEVPAGKTWRDLVDDEIFHYLEGELPIVEFVSLRK
ncbi:hypothetical protein JCM3766R1_004874 [Sporobolomyces carnicolor]